MKKQNILRYNKIDIFTLLKAYQKKHDKQTKYIWRYMKPIFCYDYIYYGTYNAWNIKWLIKRNRKSISQTDKQYIFSLILGVPVKEISYF